jgi:DNA-binding NarL/FixJ family response regulator
MQLPPLLALVFGLTATWFDYRLNLHLDLARHLNEMRRRAASSGSRLARASARLLAAGERDALQARVELIPDVPEVEIVAVVDDTGQVVADSTGALRGRAVVNTPLAPAAALINPAGQGAVLEGENADAVLSAHPFPLGEMRLGWALAVFNRAEAVALARADARTQLRWMALAMALLSFALWAVLHFGFAARLGSLAESVLAFGEGKTDAPVVRGGGDEVGKLSGAIAAMAAKLRERDAEQVRLEREVLEISARERQRIGRDLHDGLGQRLTAASMTTNALVMAAQKANVPMLAERGEEIGRQLREAIVETRALAHGLSPVALLDDGLMNALAALAESTSRGAAVRAGAPRRRRGGGASLPHRAGGGEQCAQTRGADGDSHRFGTPRGHDRAGGGRRRRRLRSRASRQRWDRPACDAVPRAAHRRHAANWLGTSRRRAYFLPRPASRMNAAKAKTTATVKSRILLVDDHRMVLTGYQLMLDAEPDLMVCATATSVPEALVALEREVPDLVVSDLNMAGRGGIDLIKDLAGLYPALRILVCSMHDETLYAERALRAGAKGNVMKDADGPTFLAAIRRVLSGRVFLSAQLAARVLDAFAGAHPRGSSSPLGKLSDREFEVFRLFGEGKTAKEIAGQLNLSPKTISVHRDHIKEKLQFATSAEMIRQAVRYVETERMGGVKE